MTRSKTLDGIRGVAILLVLVWHYLASQVFPGKGGAMEYVDRSLSLTWSGVDLFFVLSGFLIVGILLDAKGSGNYFKTFYIRRVCRILPLYLCMLCLFLILPVFVQSDWLFANPLPLVGYFTFTQNFFMHESGFGPNWLGITWSLAVEEQFYLLLPVLVWRLTRKQLFIVLATMICLAPVFRFAIGNLGAYVFPFARADSILMGGLLALIFRTPQVKTILVDNYRYLVAILLFLLAGVGVLSVGLSSIGNVFNHLWLGLFYSVLIAICLIREDTTGNSAFSNPLLIWLGLRSYAIYLFHQPVSGLVHRYFTGSSVPKMSSLNDSVATMLSLLMLIFLAEMSYRYFESRFLAYGRRFKY